MGTYSYNKENSRGLDFQPCGMSDEERDEKIADQSGHQLGFPAKK
jgi:hypothetical protein